MTSKQEAVRQIRRSLDMMVYRRVLIAIGIGVALGLIYGLAKLRDYDAALGWFFVGFMAVILCPVYAVWGYRMWKLFRAPEEYFFTRATLASPHQNWWRRAMYFTVVIDHPEEGTIAVSTNPIFFPSGFEQPLLEDYLNKTVTVGYNRQTGMVVVIG